MDIGLLDAAVRAACPAIDGVRVGDPGNKSTWSVAFSPSATEDQKVYANAALSAFDPNTPAPIEKDFLGFIALFTADEQTAIFASADTNVKRFIAMAAGVPIMHLNDPRVSGGVAYLSTLGLIAALRVPQILAGATPA